MTSIATIGLYISYVIPSLLRITVARKTFQAGAFSLGALSVPIGLAAVLWVCFITVIFVLPTEFPGGWGWVGTAAWCSCGRR